MIKKPDDKSKYGTIGTLCNYIHRCIRISIKVFTSGIRIV